MRLENVNASERRRKTSTLTFKVQFFERVPPLRSKLEPFFSRGLIFARPTTV